MPRVFLIKKHSPGNDTTGSKGTKPLAPKESENFESRIQPATSMEGIRPDYSYPDSKGPFDLSLKSRRTGIDDKENPTFEIASPSSVREFSPKIVTSSTVLAPPVGVAMIDRIPPSPCHLLKPVVPIENFNPSNSKSTWQRPDCFSKSFISMNYSFLSLPRPTPEYYSPPGPYLGSTALVSPPRIQLSPSSETNFPSCNLPFEETLLKDNSPFLSPWISKEGSTSRSDSNDSTRKANSSIVAPRYECVDCNKSYATYSGLSRHRQFHCITQTMKSFKCKYCEKVYISLGALKMHIRTHTLPCKCNLCGKAFSRPWLLQGHIRTHTGEKPFACHFCSRSFADRSNLRAHLQTHSDVKRYSCNACGKTFSRMSLLSKHMDGGCANAPILQ